MTTSDSASAAEARTVAGESARTFQDAFTERLVAVYLLGSLAHGGYAPAVSDIDLAVILADTADGDSATVHTTSETLRGQGGLYRKLSIFWASLPALRGGRDDGRFPALDRRDLADHGVLLLGSDILQEVARPPADELSVESARFAVSLLATDEVIAEFHQPNRLLADPVYFTKAVLFPVRFLYTNTRTTKHAAPNGDAIAWYLAQPDPVAQSLVRFAERVRAGHPLDLTQAKPELASLVPLYHHYINEQTELLNRVNAPADLITAFVDWSRKLLRG